MEKFVSDLFEYQKTFSVEDCNNNPHKLYVFGDNFARRGKKGQAVIRDCPNAVGIATKRKPSMSEDAFFTPGMCTTYAAAEVANVFEIFADGDYTNIVLPGNGLGTGLAQLSKRAPQILVAINKVFYR